jgi:signal transduction histidine kinase
LLARRGADVPGRELLDFDAIVEGEVAALSGGRIAIEAFGVAPAQVRGDEGQLRRMVRNLVENALHHAKSRVAITVCEERGRVALTVVDDGPGIAAVDRERIFERFVRLDTARARNAGGSGLGLAIVKAIVEGHGGSVGVDEAEGGGAAFRVELAAAR